MIKAAFSKLRRISTKLGVSLSRCNLEVQLPDPRGHPAKLAVAGEEPTTEAEAAKRGVEVPEGLLREAVHGVTVKRQKGERRNTGESIFRECAEQVEPKIEYLKLWRKLLKIAPLKLISGANNGVSKGVLFVAKVQTWKIADYV